MEWQIHRLRLMLVSLISTQWQMGRSVFLWSSTPKHITSVMSFTLRECVYNSISSFILTSLNVSSKSVMSNRQKEIYLPWQTERLSTKFIQWPTYRGPCTLGEVECVRWAPQSDRSASSQLLGVLVIVPTGVTIDTTTGIWNDVSVGFDDRVIDEDVHVVTSTQRTWCWLYW